MKSRLPASRYNWICSHMLIRSLASPWVVHPAEKVAQDFFGQSRIMFYVVHSGVVVVVISKKLMTCPMRFFLYSRVRCTMQAGRCDVVGVVGH